MKKLFYLAIASLGLMLSASCSKDALDDISEGWYETKSFKNVITSGGKTTEESHESDAGQFILIKKSGSYLYAYDFFYTYNNELKCTVCVKLKDGKESYEAEDGRSCSFEVKADGDNLTIITKMVGDYDYVQEKLVTDYTRTTTYAESCDVPDGYKEGMEKGENVQIVTIKDFIEPVNK